MKMKAGFLLALTMILVVLWCVSASGELMLSCDGTICQCETKKEATEELVYRVLCRGSGQNHTQSAVLSDFPFASEPVPDANRQVDVRLNDFASVRVEATFLSRWLAYSSCAFGLQNAGQVEFPQQRPAVAETEAIVFQFAGIDVAQSSIERFPHDLFKGKSSVGLTLKSGASVNYLNVSNLFPRKLKELRIEDSTVKVMGGNPLHSLDIETPFSIVEIKNSKIGYLSPGALVFKDRKSSFMNPKVVIENSTIGVLENLSVTIGKGIDFKVRGSTLGYISPRAFNFNNKIKSFVTFKRNLMGLNIKSLSTLKCSRRLNIQDNYFYPDIFPECLFRGNGMTLSPSCSQVPSYIDFSCQDNHIVGGENYYTTTTEPPITTTTTTTTPTTTPPPTTTTPMKITTKTLPPPPPTTTTTTTTTTTPTTTTATTTTLPPSTTTTPTTTTTTPTTTPTPPPPTTTSSTATPPQEQTSTTVTPAHTPPAPVAKPFGPICNDTRLEILAAKNIYIIWLYLLAGLCAFLVLIIAILIVVLKRVQQTTFLTLDELYKPSSPNKPSFPDIDLTKLDEGNVEETPPLCLSSQSPVFKSKFDLTHKEDIHLIF